MALFAVAACSRDEAPAPELDSAEAPELVRSLRDELHRAETAFAGGDYETAASSFRVALSYLPTADRADKGAQLLQLGSADRYASYVAAVHDNIGVSFMRLGRYVEAEASIREALVIDSQRALFHANLGTCLMRMNRLDEAAEAMRTAIELAPDDTETLTRLGQVLVTLGRAEEAVPQLLDALERIEKPDLDGALVDAWLALGAAYEANNEPERAVDAFLRALQLAPGTTLAWYRLSILLGRAGKPEEAAAAQQRVQLLAPADNQLQALQSLQSPTVAELQSRADLLRAIGRPHQARRQYEKLAEREPAEACHWLALAELSELLGAPDRASAAYRQTLALRPGCREAAAHIDAADPDAPSCCADSSTQQPPD